MNVGNKIMYSLKIPIFFNFNKSHYLYFMRLIYFSEKVSISFTRICKWPMTQARLRTALLESYNICVQKQAEGRKGKYLWGQAVA
jgi:hypothetical protein